jgi:predicted  nucleic acid-binding Zn-ribbon protein
MNKKWLILGSISFGVAFGIGFVVNKDIKQSTLTGLISLPATIASASVIEHQRKRQLNDTISSLQKRENELSDRLALLQTKIEIHQQQESTLIQNVFTIETEKEKLENTLADLGISKQQREAAIASLATQVTELSSQKQNLTAENDRLEIQIIDLKEKVKRQQELEKAIALLQTSAINLETQVGDLRQQKLIVEQQITELEAQKQSLTTEFNCLENKIRELQERKINLDRSFDEISDRKQQLELACNELQNQRDLLEIQIIDLNEKVNSQQELQEAIALLRTNLDELETQISDRQQQKIDLEQTIANLEECLQDDTAEHEQLKNQLHALQQEQSKLDSTISEKSDRKQELEAEYRDLQNKIDELNSKAKELEKFPREVEDPDSVIDIAPELTPETSETKDLNFFWIAIPDPHKKINPEYINNLWEKFILPYWQHRDRPKERRFLGSIPIQQSESDRLLNLVGKSLKGFYKGITYDGLENYFGGYYLGKKNWIRFFTFLISEYAYFYSEKDVGFWKGLCKKFNIPHSSRLEDIFRQVVDEGIKLLGLVRATGGYEYVSTLWLQNGIPFKNLEHFSQLLQATADEYGWWEISHSEPKDIAELLLKDCQQKYPSWKTLTHFLKASYSEEKEFEPISGELVRGISRVAQALEREKLPVHVLADYSERKKIIEDYPLPQNFFLRDWKTLIEVLEPKAGSGNRIVSRRNRSLFLMLDIGNTGKTQLILPEQKIWKSEWKNLRGTYCLIPNADWESNIPAVGDLEIPELAIDIEKTEETWSCDLLNHYLNSIHQWKSQGINSQLPCLIFDAMKGNHLSINLPNAQIVGVEEIICFTPKEMTIDFDKGIEVVDRYVPSSIKGWQGQQVRLTELTSSIVITLPNTKESQTISWKRHEDKEPTLTGLRLKENKTIDIYIETPTFWYPPHERELNLNILIENLTERVILEKTFQALQPNNDWLAIPLNRWITKPGKYEVCFWVNYDRWTYRFEFQENYQISKNSNLKQPLTINLSGLIQTKFPIQFNRSEKFWAEIIKIEGLWTLEEVLFILSNREDQVTYQVQADTSGSLTLNLSVLYDLLPQSNWYTLDYQRLGLEAQRLLECSTKV